MVGLLRDCVFSGGDPDGGRGRRRGRGGRGTESAARRKSAFAQAYRLCHVFRGESAGAKGGSRTAAAPQTAPKSLRLSGLSSFGSRRGCVSRGEGVVCTTKTCANIAITSAPDPSHPRPAVARIHGETCPAPIYGRASRAVQRSYQHAQTSRLEPPGGSGAESGCVREAVWLSALPTAREAVCQRALPAVRPSL